MTQRKGGDERLGRRCFTFLSAHPTRPSVSGRFNTTPPFAECRSWSAGDLLKVVNNDGHLSPSTLITAQFLFSYWWGIHSLKQPALCAQGRRWWWWWWWDGSTARVSMHIHASPPHRLTATTLRWEGWETARRELGMDKRLDGGGADGDLFSFFPASNTLEILWRSMFGPFGQSGKTKSS